VTTADRTPGGTAGSRSSELTEEATGYTGPAVVFRHDGPDPTVVGVNAALAALVDGVDDSLGTLLDRATDHDGHALAATVVDSERVGTAVRFADGGRRFLPRVVRETDDGLCHLLFVRLPTSVTGDAPSDETGGDGVEKPTSEKTGGEETASESDATSESNSTSEETASEEPTDESDSTGEESAAARDGEPVGDEGVVAPGDDCDGVDDSEAVAHVVSHDLRNPLDVAAAHLELARDERDGEHLQRVAEAHERMEQIIRDVLTLARGERAISPSDGVDLGAVVTDAWESVAADDVELSVRDVPTATADRPRVERLVENLLRNAVDHAGPAPTIRAGGLADDAGFYVADDGDGVPSDIRETVFEPGYTESGDGTGLGLAIVRRIAAAHGWQVRLADSDAGGARVEVWFEEPPEETP
jgi:anti-sigma regulatory factor (Ser/Thr protein kinase)